MEIFSELDTVLVNVRSRLLFTCRSSIVDLIYPSTWLRRGMSEHYTEDSDWAVLSLPTNGATIECSLKVKKPWFLRRFKEVTNRRE